MGVPSTGDGIDVVRGCHIDNEIGGNRPPL
jgi:hypothetical protein